VIVIALGIAVSAVRLGDDAGRESGRAESGEWRVEQSRAESAQKKLLSYEGGEE
jgi:hypothetical protein